MVVPEEYEQSLLDSLKVALDPCIPPKKESLEYWSPIHFVDNAALLSKPDKLLCGRLKRLRDAGELESLIVFIAVVESANSHFKQCSNEKFGELRKSLGCRLKFSFKTHKFDPDPRNSMSKSNSSAHSG